MTRHSHPHLLQAVILAELFNQLDFFDFAFELLTARGFFPIFLVAGHVVQGRLAPLRIVEQFLS